MGDGNPSAEAAVVAAPNPLDQCGDGSAGAETLPYPTETVHQEQVHSEGDENRAGDCMDIDTNHLNSGAASDPDQIGEDEGAGEDSGAEAPQETQEDRRPSLLSVLEKIGGDRRMVEQVDTEELEKVKQGSGVFYNFREGAATKEEDLVADVQSQLKRSHAKKCWLRFQAVRRAIYRVFDDPGSSWVAKVVNFFVLFWIVLSTITFIIETLPELRDETLTFFVIECVVVVVFTCEYAIRLLCSPKPWIFPFKPMNVIDFLAILPFYLDLLILAITADGDSSGAGSAFRVLRTVRLVRVFRVFKLGRHSTSMKIFMQTLKKSLDALILLVFYMAIAIIVFSALVYFMERGEWNEAEGAYYVTDSDGNYVKSEYESIPASTYWTVTTITSVGYGDVVPFSGGGRTIGVLAMVFGILVMSFPISVIGTQFSEMWIEKTMEKHFKKLEDEKEEKEQRKKKNIMRELKKRNQERKRSKVSPEETDNADDEVIPTVPPDPVDEVFRLLRNKALDFEYQKLLFEDLAEMISYKMTVKRERCSEEKLKQGPALYLVVDLMSTDIGRKIEAAMLATLRIRKILDSLTWTIFDPRAIDIEKELLTRDAAAAIVRWQEWIDKRENDPNNGGVSSGDEDPVPVKSGGRLKALAKPIMAMQKSMLAKASSGKRNKIKKQHEAMGLRSVLNQMGDKARKNTRVTFAVDGKDDSGTGTPQSRGCTPRQHEGNGQETGAGVQLDDGIAAQPNATEQT